MALLAATAVLRLAHLVAVRDAPFVGQLALDSQEYDRWARAIAAGDWLGSAPFFQAPLYPYLVALVYRFLAAAPVAVYLLQIAVAVLGCWALVRAGEALAGPRAAGATGLLFALYTPFWFYDVQLMKESFAVSAVCLLLFLLLKARASDRLALWFLVGLVSAFLALLRENMLLVVPFLLLLTWRERTGKGWMLALRRCGLLLLGLSLPLLVVASRNAALGGGFLPTTSQGGVNFWIGNNPAADGTYRPLVPGQAGACLRARRGAHSRRAGGRPAARGGRGLGLLAASLAFVGARRAAGFRPSAARQARPLLGRLRVAGRGRLLLDEDDLAAARACRGSSGARRRCSRSGGLLLERRRLAVWAPVLLFELGWMLSVVAFFVFSRYRLPAVPGLLLLAAIPVARAAEAFAKETSGGAAAMFAGVAILWLAPHVPGYAPRLDLVEFNLGRLAEERGDFAAAAAHYERTLAADPQNLSATLNLGNLAARAGDYCDRARPLQRAVDLAPDSDDAHANLGGALLAAGDLAGAERELERALELNPENRFARHNLEILRRRAAAPAAP